jgi:hypothetical protein
MGRKARAKRERKRPSAPDHAAWFRSALADVEAEDGQLTFASTVDYVLLFAQKVLEQPPDEGAVATVFLMPNLCSPPPWGCVRCGTSTTFVRGWMPSLAEISEDIGMEPDLKIAVLYPICWECAQRCRARDPASIRAVDRAVL